VVWRGVPYAQQPIGERRFAAPAPVLPWTGVPHAIEHGPLPAAEPLDGRRRPQRPEDSRRSLLDGDGVVAGPVRLAAGDGVDPRRGVPQRAPGNCSSTTGRGWPRTAMSWSSMSPTRVGVFGSFELGDLGDDFDDNLCLRDQIAAWPGFVTTLRRLGGDADRVTVFGDLRAPLRY